jgi:hypothetical protein
MPDPCTALSTPSGSGSNAERFYDARDTGDALLLVWNGPLDMVVLWELLGLHASNQIHGCNPGFSAPDGPDHEQ